jgi:PBP1b-binding outer membrane lipoprotein LpoB
MKKILLIILFVALFISGCTKQQPIKYVCYDSREPLEIIEINTFVGSDLEANLLSECQKLTSKVIIQKVKE